MIRNGAMSTIGRGVLAVLAVWLLWPVLLAQHLEGYTTNLQALAILGGRNPAAPADLAYPLLTEFLYHTRTGMIVLLRAIYAILGPVGDTAFRLVMISSLALLLGSSVTVARRLADVPAWAAFLALLLIPGVTEASFVFNDNLPAAAIVAAAVALVARRGGVGRYALAGMLIGAGALIRLDAVLLAPLVVATAWLREGTALLVRRTLAAGAGGLIVLVLGSVFLRSTPLDALAVSKGFVPPFSLWTALHTPVLFFGLAGSALMAAGILVALLRPAGSDAPSQWRYRLVWAGLPLLLLPVAVRLSSELRYVYPTLSVFVAVLGGTALAAAARRRATMVGTAVAIGVLALLPPGVYVLDGPPAFWGRLWMPVLWGRWEATMRGNLSAVDRLVADAGRHRRTLVINTNFNDEFFLKERLIQAGYRVEPAARSGPGCDGFSAYRRSLSAVFQIRTHNQYARVTTSHPRFAATVIGRALSCPAVANAQVHYLTAYGSTARVFFPDVVAPALWQPVWHRFEPIRAMSESFGAPWPAGWHSVTARPDEPRRQIDGRLRVMPLSGAEVAALGRSAERYRTKPLTTGADALPGPADGPVVMADIHRAFASRCLPLGDRRPASFLKRCGSEPIR